MRHGKSESRSITGQDEDRKLSDEGIEAIKRVLGFARVLGMKPTRILTSTYARAYQTAKLSAEAFDNPILEVERMLEPGHTPYELFEALSGVKQSDAILLVTHQPMILEVLSSLIGAEVNVSFEPSSLACVEVKGSLGKDPGTLRWLLPGLG